MKRRLPLLVAAAAFAAGCAALGIWFDAASLITFDVRVSEWFDRMANDPLTTAFVVITTFGSAAGMVPICLIVAAVMLFRYRFYRETLTIVAALVGAKLLNETIKAIVQRSRPAWEHLAAADGYSFPSGHAMVSMAFYGMLAYTVGIHVKSRAAVYVAAVLLVLLIGASRLYLQVHYATDVIAGYAGGAAWLLVCIALYRTGWKNVRS